VRVGGTCAIVCSASAVIVRLYALRAGIVHGLGLWTAGAQLATTAVALEAGHARLAAARALAGAENADRVGARLAAGLPRSLAGRAFAALGQTERAAAKLERAVAELEAYGARRHVAAAERELRRLRPPRVTHLTPAVRSQIRVRTRCRKASDQRR
jgi:hypothetical protein